MLALLFTLPGKSISASSPTASPIFKRLEAQRNGFCEKADGSWERLLACESKLVVELNEAMLKAAELKMSLDASAAHFFLFCTGYLRASKPLRWKRFGTSLVA